MRTDLTVVTLSPIPHARIESDDKLRCSEGAYYPQSNVELS
jgi:hypothetical protein